MKVGPNFIISQTKHGFVCAISDESNVGENLATPCQNSDKSALIQVIFRKTGKDVSVILSDTWVVFP